MITLEKLDNGIRVVMERMDGCRSVAIGAWVKAGSVDENSGENGITHFIEHMLFKGTSSRSAKDIAVEMDAVGGNLNAFTAKECTCFYANILDEHVDLAVDVLADMIMNPRLDPDDIGREKGVVIEEIHMTGDIPEDLVQETLAGLLYAGDPLARPILGKEETVESFTRESILGYMHRRYTPDNIVISCAGNFEREKLMDELNERFGRISPSHDGSTRVYGEKRGARLFKSIEKDIGQVQICMGLPGFAVGEAGQYPLGVLSNAFGGSMSSRLFQHIREDSGMAYSVYSFTSSYSATGSFGMYAGTSEKQAPKVLDALMNEIENVKRSGITPDELERSKEQMKGSYIIGFEGTSAHSSANGKAMLLRNKLYSSDDVIRKIDGVTMDDINDIIPHVFDADRLCAAFVGKGTQKLADSFK